MFNVPRRYIPSFLTKKDKKKQSKALRRSRRAYKKGKYYTRKKVKSFKSKVSPHVVKAKKMYKINKISASKNLSRKTKCKIKGLRKIVKKGQGAYYSSGSRPNQTGHSWGRARLASSITGGKASAVDYKILLENCSKNSKALRLAKRARTKYNKGRRNRLIRVGIGLLITFIGFNLLIKSVESSYKLLSWILLIIGVYILGKVRFESGRAFWRKYGIEQNEMFGYKKLVKKKKSK